MAVRAAHWNRARRCAVVTMSSAARAGGQGKATEKPTRPTVGEECRTIVRNATFGVLSTISASEPSGFPVGSVVAYAGDEKGRPLMFLSTLSKHTRDLQVDDKASLTVATGLGSAEDARVTLVGPVKRVEDSQEVQRIRERFAQAHPDAFWIDFGDFQPHRMERVLQARFVGGFARAGTASEEDYLHAMPDPVAQFTGPVAKHMNEDHETQTILCVKHFCDVDAESAKIVALDRLGMDVQVSYDGSTHRVRLPFLHPAEDRKAIKDRIVELIKIATAALAETLEDPQQSS